MAEVTFDPDHIFMIADLAAAMGITRGGATSWVNSRLVKGVIDPPIFEFAQGSNTIRVWSAEQGERMVKLYREQRAG